MQEARQKVISVELSELGEGASSFLSPSGKASPSRQSLERSEQGRVVLVGLTIPGVVSVPKSVTSLDSVHSPEEPGSLRGPIPQMRRLRPKRGTQRE